MRTVSIMRPLQLLILFLLVMLPIATVLAQDAAGADLTAEAVNAPDSHGPGRVRPSSPRPG
jgi:hypothetical protein